MLKHFSWQQFLIAALILSCIWYLVVLPLLYRRRLKGWIGDKAGKPDAPVRREWDRDEFEPLDEVDEDAAHDLMGKPKLPEGVTKVTMDSLRFADRDWVDGDSLDAVVELADDKRELQQSLVPDAIEELKSIFLVLEREEGTKADFISLFALVKAKYGALAGTPSERALNAFIRENALFAISDEELVNLWA